MQCARVRTGKHEYVVGRAKQQAGEAACERVFLCCLVRLLVFETHQRRRVFGVRTSTHLEGGGFGQWAVRGLWRVVVGLGALAQTTGVADSTGTKSAPQVGNRLIVAGIAALSLAVWNCLGKRCANVQTAPGRESRAPPP